MFCVGVCLFYLLIVQEILWNKFNTRYTLSIWDWVYVLFWPIPFGWCIIKKTPTGG